MDKGQAQYHLMTTAARGLSALPEPVALATAALVGEVLFRVRPDHRAMVSRNLRRVVGAKDGEDELVDRWARRAFRAYARYWVEGARLGRTSPQAVERRFLVDGLHHLESAMAAGRGTILALPHVGSWEFGGAFLAGRGMPMTAVAERLEPPELFEFFVAQREAMGLTVVPLDEGSSAAILGTLRRGGLVGLLCDRDLEGNGIEVEFFGEKTTMPAGPATLALRTGAALMTAAVYSGPGPEHLGVVEAPLDLTRTGSLRVDVRRLTQEIATRLEGLIRRAPEQWHVFQPLWSADRMAVGA